jgi:hypothetical protein
MSSPPLLFLSCALFRFPRACKKAPRKERRKEGRESEREEEEEEGKCKRRIV